MSQALSTPQALARPPAAETPEADVGLPYDLIETLFFAYRDFVGDPDRILTRYNFGRAHHRVLHFVNRNPGLTIAELLDILQITKQSLNRVLKELLEQGYVESRAGETDRRQRLLFPTAKGQELALALARPQAAIDLDKLDLSFDPDTMHYFPSLRVTSLGAWIPAALYGMADVLGIDRRPA